jgi:hypothetical protein
MCMSTSIITHIIDPPNYGYWYPPLTWSRGCWFRLENVADGFHATKFAKLKALYLTPMLALGELNSEKVLASLDKQLRQMGIKRF